MRTTVKCPRCHTDLTVRVKNPPVVGLHRHVPDSEIDPEQLKIGTWVEMEHTNDPAIAKEIAKDHILGEMLDYYVRLEAMERAAGHGDEWDEGRRSGWKV